MRAAEGHWAVLSSDLKSNCRGLADSVYGDFDTDGIMAITIHANGARSPRCPGSGLYSSPGFGGSRNALGCSAELLAYCVSTIITVDQGGITKPLLAQSSWE